jgi:hypothetical protein
MIFSLYLLLFPYFAFLFVWTLFSLAAVFHMVKFGFRGLVSIVATFVYVGISVFLLTVSYGYITNIDWHQEVTVFGNIAGFLSFLKIH